MAKHQSALDSFMHFYAAPAEPAAPVIATSPLKSSLRHSSYNIAPLSPAEDFDKQGKYSPGGLQHVSSSPSHLTSPGSRVSLPLDSLIANSPPTKSSPSSKPSSPHSPDTGLSMKKSTSTPLIPSQRFGLRESSDSTVSSYSSMSRSDSESTPGMERTNSLVILSDDDDYDTDSALSSELDDNDSPTSTSSRSDGPSPPSSLDGTVRRKSTNARYFPTSEASLEKFFKPPEQSHELPEDQKEGAVKFKKATEEDYQKMMKNPEAYNNSKLAKLNRRSSRMSEKEEPFVPSQDTVVKSTVLKQVFFEKHTLIAADPKKYQAELLSSRGALEPRYLPPDVKKKLKKLNIQFMATKEARDARGRDRSKSSPTVPSQMSRTLSLSDIIARDGTTIPRVVKLCLDFLTTEESLKTEGLFRVAGNSYEIDILWESLNDGDTIPPNADVHTVTSVFKRFFRELKEPLFTYKLHKKFLHAVNDDLTEDEQNKNLKETLEEVPDQNRTIIRLLFQFLRKVMNYSESNMMHAVNLGIVFGPSLLRDDSSTMAMFDNRNQVVTTVLENHDYIFDVTPGAVENAAA